MASFTLLGFTLSVFCSGICPMNLAIEQQSGEGHDMHSMHAMHHMEADADDRPCERCSEHADESLLLQTSVVVSGAAVQNGVVSTMVHTVVQDVSHIPIQTHLAAADPPRAPSIVRTIVLRT